MRCESSRKRRGTARRSLPTSPIASQSSEPQIIARELANRDTAHQFHVAFQFSFHQAKCPLDPSLAGGSQGIEIIAADPNRLGADRERLEDMRPALHPAVHEYIDPITYGVDDFGQLVERCPRAV